MDQPSLNSEIHNNRLSMTIALWKVTAIDWHVSKLVAKVWETSTGKNSRGPVTTKIDTLSRKRPDYRAPKFLGCLPSINWFVKAVCFICICCTL